MADYKIKNTVYVVADPHGNYDMLCNGISNSEIEDATLIVAGDCGFGFHPLDKTLMLLSKLNKQLSKQNIDCYMIRGNHDDPSFFDDKTIVLSNIIAISDYSVLYNDTKSILCVGGAISIDRTYRKESDLHTMLLGDQLGIDLSHRKTYWANEEPIYNEELLSNILNNNNINYIITHTSPSFCFKTDKYSIGYWLKRDSSLEEDLNRERQVLTQIYEKVHASVPIIETWVYGHFHEHNVELFNETKFVALANADRYFDCVELT